MGCEHGSGLSTFKVPSWLVSRAASPGWPLGRSSITVSAQGPTICCNGQSPPTRAARKARPEAGQMSPVCLVAFAQPDRNGWSPQARREHFEGRQKRPGGSMRPHLELLASPGITLGKDNNQPPPPTPSSPSKQQQPGAFFSLSPF